mmetsp:Transcript_107157/g.196746  ORF Transcript_107157/g.196746 Transcript_107157/m.196746 type:complete len:304 (-) Transcript_107157:125-1036(-)
MAFDEALIGNSQSEPESPSAEGNVSVTFSNGSSVPKSISAPNSSIIISRAAFDAHCCTAESGLSGTAPAPSASCSRGISSSKATLGRTSDSERWICSRYAPSWVTANLRISATSSLVSLQELTAFSISGATVVSTPEISPSRPARISTSLTIDDSFTDACWRCCISALVFLAPHQTQRSCLSVFLKSNTASICDWILCSSDVACDKRSVQVEHTSLSSVSTSRIVCMRSPFSSKSSSLRLRACSKCSSRRLASSRRRTRSLSCCSESFCLSCQVWPMKPWSSSILLSYFSSISRSSVAVASAA